MRKYRNQPLDKVTELLSKLETQKEVLLKIAQHPRTSEIEVNKALACRRFVVDFERELKNLRVMVL